MKTTGRAIAAIMLMFAAVLVAGCTKDNYSHDDDNTDKVTINPEYVPIDWKTTTVTAYDDSIGDYTIRFADTVPDIHPGSVIAIDRDTVVLYRFVTGVNVSGNTMMITSVEAYLTDIFYDTEFTLSTAAEGNTKAKGVVFRPVEAYVMDGKGGYQVIDMTAQRKGDTRFTHNLWHNGFNYDGHVIHAGNNDSIVLDKMNMDLDLDMEMYMNFGGRDVCEVVNDAIDRYRSNAMNVNAALVGKFNTEQRIRCKVWGSCSYTPDYDLWKHNLFRPLTMKFMAGYVPIVLVLRSDLYRQVEVSASGEMQAYTGFTDHAEGRLGFDWSQAGGISPVATFENTFNYTPPTVEGKGQIQAKVWVFPRIKVMLYDRVGPSFDFMPYLADTVRGGFREQMLGQTNDYCAWSLDCHAGLDLRCGLSLNHIFFGYEVENYSTPKWKCADFKLYHSPKKVLHASGRPQGGQTATVRFDVYDQNYLFDREVMTPLPQIVKFEASGDLSSEYGIARDGTVQVNWTPNGSDTLWAKLYDQDGNVMSFDTVIVRCDSNLTSGDWVDLGLPSGRQWATRNVGASSPTDYGNYYAWGETTPKSVYDWSTYRYARYDSDQGEYVPTKYTGTDGLTILQPGDDAATANYGGRTPTKAEWEELVNNTTSRWMTVNGVYGRCFTGPNGNSLFLPAAGGRRGGSLYYTGTHGYYWSSSLDTYEPRNAWYFDFWAGYVYMDDYCYCYRYYGRTVRAVR